MHSDNMGAELLFGIPPKLTLDMQRADGTTVTNAATVKSWTPVYGAGLVYTWMTAEASMQVFRICQSEQQQHTWVRLAP